MLYYLALGSNLGKRMDFLAGAVNALGDEVTKISNVYETEPVGGPTNQYPYLNLVLQVETDSGPFAMLRRVSSIETDSGRVRGVVNGPRTLDIDIVFIEGVRVRSKDLIVPHPRAFERGFVIAPLADLSPSVALRLSPSLFRAINRETPRIGSKALPGVVDVGSLDGIINAV